MSRFEFQYYSNVFPFAQCENIVILLKCPNILIFVPNIHHIKFSNENGHFYTLKNSPAKANVGIEAKAEQQMNKQGRAEPHSRFPQNCQYLTRFSLTLKIVSN